MLIHRAGVLSDKHSCKQYMIISVTTCEAGSLSNSQISIRSWCTELNEKLIYFTDTYVKTYLRENKKRLQHKKTTIVKANTNPSYNQKLKYSAYNVHGRYMQVWIHTCCNTKKYLLKVQHKEAEYLHIRVSIKGDIIGFNHFSHTWFVLVKTILGGLFWNNAGKKFSEKFLEQKKIYLWLIYVFLKDCTF